MKPLWTVLAGVVVFAIGQLPAFRGTAWLAVPLLCGMVAGALWVHAFMEWRWKR